MLTSLEYEENELTFTADYFIGGARVYLDEGDAARVTIRDGQIYSMTLVVREFSRTQTAMQKLLLPSVQAIAASVTGTELAYASSGAGYVAPYWKAVSP